MKRQTTQLTEENKKEIISLYYQSYYYNEYCLNTDGPLEYVYDNSNYSMKAIKEYAETDMEDDMYISHQEKLVTIENFTTLVNNLKELAIKLNVWSKELDFIKQYNEIDRRSQILL